MTTSDPLDLPVEEQALQVRGSNYVPVAVDPSTGLVSQDEEIESSAESFLAELNKLEATKTLTLALRPKKKRKTSEPIDERKREQKDEEDGNSSGGSVYYSNSSQEEEALYQKQCTEIAQKFRVAIGSPTLAGKNRGRMLRHGKIHEPESQPRSKSPSPETDVDLKTETSSDCTDVSWMLDTGMLELGETDLIFDSEGRSGGGPQATNLERVMDEEAEGDEAENAKRRLVRGGLKKILCGIPAEGGSHVEIKKKKITQRGQDGKDSDRGHELRDITLAAAATGAIVAGLWMAEQRRYGS
jgi:hypothetical protein